MRRLRFLQAAVLLALLTLSAGCQTTIGNYFGNRARDFVEWLLLQIGIGVELGADEMSAALAHMGRLR